MSARTAAGVGTKSEYDCRRVAAGRFARLLARIAKARARRTSPGLRWKAHWVAQEEAIAPSGVRIRHEHLHFAGLRVYRAVRVVKRCGRRWSSSFAAEAVPRDTPTLPTLTASASLDRAVSFLVKRGLAPRRLRVVPGGEQRIALESAPTVLEAGPGFAEPVRAHLEVFALDASLAVPSWVLEVAPVGAGRFEVAVAAEAGGPVLFCTRVDSCLTFDARWRPHPAAPLALQSHPRAPNLQPLGHAPRTASDWLAAAGVAEGPHVVCYSGSGGQATALASESVENAFVWCNTLFDLFAGFGFDDSLGAFGAGQDPLRVRLWNSSYEGAGWFVNDVDGARPLMALHANKKKAGCHAALDPTIVVHEYVHGVTSRLLGGRSLKNPYSGREAQGLNEGYSDYFALTVVSALARRDGQPDVRSIGSLFAPPALRDYSGFRKRFGKGLDRYGLGMVWCAGLLDGRQRLLGDLGMAPDAADTYVWEALLTSLRGMAPSCPRHGCLTLGHARDALRTAATQVATDRSTQVPAAAPAALDQGLADRGI